MSERCEVTELLKDQCGHCKPAPQVPRDQKYGPWVIAQFDSECDGPCNGQIDEGEHTRSDGEGGWLCELCGGFDGER